MILLNIHNLSFPIEDPVLKFLLVLIIILAAPLLLNKIKVPHLLGLIIAGAVIGPNGFNILSRDSSIVVTGTTGLLYIMFLAGLEIDMGDFKRNKWKSLTFGIYTFTVPFVLGYLGAYYLLGFSMLTSILFASLFSSHTLIAYPLVSKLGISKNLAVNITVGGTMITDILALLVLAVIVGMSQGEVGTEFWVKLSVSFIVFGLIVLLIFPIIGRWFFKKVDDKISQYIFVLVMIYLAAMLAELAGVEAIIGAFFAGLALNRLIPHTSSLMNRVEFVGNAIFIPFFLISVGMLIDFKVFFKSWETLEVAAIMLIASIGGKYLSAVATQKTFRLSKEEGKLIFGLSSASAAATLASVMVGYNIILSETETGEPVRLLNEHVLNGSILLILVSCTISSFISMASAQKIAESDNEDTVSGNSHEEENILLAVNHPETVERMVNLGMLIKAHSNTDHVFALNVINEDKNESSVKNAEKILHQATDTAAAADVKLQALKRYDNDVINGVNNVIKEQNITDLIIGLEDVKGFSPSFVYNLYNGYLQNDDVNVLVYHAAQPLSTIKKYAVMIPENGHLEPGFFHALLRVWNIARNSGATMTFYAPEVILEILQKIIKKANIEAEFIIMNTWHDGEQTAAGLKENEALIILMAKRGMASYVPRMRFIPELLNKYLKNNNYLLIYPFSEYNQEYAEKRSVGNHGDFMEIGNVIKKIFK
ncbi:MULTISPECIES: cation:proton antiporter [Chryseobacterium]|uniref:Kef-type K+ transport system membrane component KefB n=1 Tax=Chryseobacterium camelliae TaxID=1265445 RepID=A0ABU0TIY1_9FLAO|nr:MULTISPECIES: cation:proton antiporter [Chryseobacterium]MDT3409135.1 Kef-type K+ transport system membrane component KefB [Pseudacidovorax intermedius]MDQ1097007.1 Kef-type K+ transport system membrane component KefB [Chryseobacterium camelliae]MDQ1100946.1 Kef-type K+ transport system membrane component KefB [Chryseobacterium sp. SORGH_AS_1048]MDR6084388.1 Kef-type K+ transport system membrane component KefB [Chryseobacterium sp. SORGH_AS_0909]MDR6132659.1 Kef-type K+ transport system mem